MSTENCNILSIERIRGPQLLKQSLPLDISTKQKICNWRNEIQAIINGQDKRLLVIIGPCSIHNIDLALDYARKLIVLREQFKDKLFIVMRVYFEKPRTTVGWKGLINDPNLNGTYDINDGLFIARKLLLMLSHWGIPTGCEFLDVFTPQYYADLVSWGAIGARTTESQLHRELASGLSMPIGFKNGTNGRIDIAIDAIVCASNPHVFIGIDDQGVASIVKTSGNSCLQVILRGSDSGTNYDHVCIDSVKKLLDKKGVKTRILVDCSHGNSGKNFKNQPLVLESVMKQIENGETSICGVMIESHINEGQQKYDIERGPCELKYGVSITDGCVSLETSVKMLERMAC